MPRLETQPCIKGFHVYKGTVVFSSGIHFLYSPLLFVLISTSSATCLLVDSVQEVGIHLDKEPWGFGRDGRLFVFLKIS